MLTGSRLRRKRVHFKLSQAKFAELTGVPQHAISSFELGKVDLSPKNIELIEHLFRNHLDSVKQVAGRRKRYRTHEYRVVRTDRERADQCKQTEGNRQYTRLLTELEKRRDHHLGGRTAISLFSGCGGLSLGFAWAGFNIKGYVEKDEGLRRIYRANFPSSMECGTDITEVSSAQLNQLSRKIGHIDAMIGGPPCQGFSLSGKRDVRDPRNTLFRHYFRFVHHFRPKVAIMENVRLLTSMRNSQGDLVRDDIVREFLRHGYKVRVFEVNAKDFGVPQHRERVFFVAALESLPFTPSFPPPTHGAALDLFGSLAPYRTFADACSDLEYLESGQKSQSDPHHTAVSHPSHTIEWLWDVKQGRSAHDNEDPNMRPPSGYNTTYKRQIWNEPGATVQTTFGMISGCRNVHPVATRSLTVREASRLQSFPDSYKFSGSVGTIRTGIGNAVPPLLAFEFGNHVNSQLHLIL